MANENCILLSNATDLALVHQRLTIAYGADGFSTDGTADNWRQVSVTRRKLFTKATVTFKPLDAAQLVEAQKRLQHVYQSIPADNPDILVRLCTKIATSRLAIDVQAPGGLRGLEEAVFAVAESLDAIIFWQGSKMLDKTGKLIMDFQGRSGISELPVQVDSSEFDALTPVTESGNARKSKTNALLIARKIPVASALPPIEGDEIARIRPVAEVAQRALALMIVAVKAEGLEDEIVQQVIEVFGIAPFLSPQERAFIQNPNPSQQDKINFIWRYESLWTLLWALGHIDSLEFPDNICDVPKSVEIIHEAGTFEAFLAKSKLRSVAEILDQCDMAYRLNWAVVNARLRGEAAPANIESGVVYERHYALNWLRCYFDQEWDTVRTDT
jgi:hypothetical protein